MTPKISKFGYKESKRAVELLGFIYKNTGGSHSHFKNPDTGKKATLPFYKEHYGDRLVRDIAWQAGLSKHDFEVLATNKAVSKKMKKIRKK